MSAQTTPYDKARLSRQAELAGESFAFDDAAGAPEESRWTGATLWCLGAGFALAGFWWLSA